VSALGDRVTASAVKLPAPAYGAIAALVVAVAAFFLSPPDARAQGAVLAGLLAWAAVIDARTYILPNPLTALIAASGLAVAAMTGRAALVDAGIGLVVGYGIFAAIGFAYRRARGKAGLGAGDAKLFAGAGAWLGWAGLPLVSLLAAVAGLLHFATLALRGRTVDAATPIAFGPHLCVAIWIVWRFAPVLAL